MSEIRQTKSLVCNRIYICHNTSPLLTLFPLLYSKQSEMSMDVISELKKDILNSRMSLLAILLCPFFDLAVCAVNKMAW